MNRLHVVLGDITRMEVDAIVNAANTKLSGGGGVDGAIHRAAGPELVKASRAQAPCPTGEARITPGFRLPAKWVIHAVGPFWSAGRRNADALLASAYRNSLQLAATHGIRTLAFPSVSTGAYRFPLEPAAEIAVRTIWDFLANSDLPAEVTLVCFNERALHAYERPVADLSDAHNNNGFAEETERSCG